MSLDNPSGEPSGTLDINQAATAFTAAFEPPKEVVEEVKVDTEIDPPAEEKPAEPNAAEEGADVITVKIDGKDVQLTPEQIAEAYKGQLRQADYTKKTMEAAELRKSADVEISKARQERNEYATNLQKMGLQLEVVLDQQQKTDWNALLESDPLEYLKQQNLYNQRQAAYQQNQQQLQTVAAQMQAEQAENHKSYMQTQQQELLAKLPSWKDQAKAMAEREALKSYLKAEGYDDQAISGITDHRAVILSRKAMLYDQMIAKASAATKKVATLPQKVERPGVSEGPNNDKRTQAYQRLAKSGKVEDAAALFANLL